MLLTDFAKLSLGAVISHRLRSFLTALGIAVGIASVVLLTSIGEGVHRFVGGLLDVRLLVQVRHRDPVQGGGVAKRTLE